MRYSKITFFILFSTALFLISSSCEEEKQHPIPDVYINFSINLFDDPQYFRLNDLGATMVVNNEDLGVLSLGYFNNGVIIHNNGDGEFFVYDRTCPHDIPDNIAIETETYSVLGTCPECGSIYVFSSMGAPADGSVSNWSLKRYQAVFNPNTGDLFVSNSY
ncbi:MAG: hypothetical protein JW801_09100 [Bacteroidales bacterium]|nr:hypothetical protein [Bacteroidales bacterium]